MKIGVHIATIILIFGFFWSPTSSYACETKTQKWCCQKEITSKSEKKDCCNTTKNSKNSKNKDTSCGGKCGHSNCTSTSSTNCSLISSFEINFNNNSFDYSKKSKFYNSKTNISSGFYSIWLIPKIG